MDKVKVKVTRLDGTILEVEGAPDEVARILRKLDEEQLSPVRAPPIIVIPAAAPVLLSPYAPAPVWGPVSPTVVPFVPGWPVITCELVPQGNTPGRC